MIKKKLRQGRPVMMVTSCKYTIRQIVRHTSFGYRGMIVDIDPTFQGALEPDRETVAGHEWDQPWYHVLVDGQDYSTYVPESQLEMCESPEPVKNPMLDEFGPKRANMGLDFH